MGRLINWNVEMLLQLLKQIPELHRPLIGHAQQRIALRCQEYIQRPAGTAPGALHEIDQVGVQGGLQFPVQLHGDEVAVDYSCYLTSTGELIKLNRIENK